MLIVLGSLVGLLVLMTIFGAIISSSDEKPSDSADSTDLPTAQVDTTESKVLTVVLGYSNQSPHGLYVYTSIVLPGLKTMDCVSQKTGQGFIPAGGSLVDTCTATFPETPDRDGRYAVVGFGWYEDDDSFDEKGGMDVYIESKPSSTEFFRGAIAADGTVSLEPSSTRPTGPTFNAFVAEAPDPIEFSGSGDKVSTSFTTENKLVRFEATHSGESNFAVWFLDDAGQQVELAVNEIGDYDGSHYFSLDTGTYVLEVTADGPWEIVIEQPVPTTGPSVPISEQGTSDDAPPCMRLDAGLHRFKMHFEGDGNFAVWLLGSDGQLLKLLANEIESWDGEAAYGVVSPGYYCLDVTGIGTWSIDVTR